jgi:hypothetical protein
MKTRFQTNRGLWMRISVILFAISWCLPLIGPKDQLYPPIFILYGSFVDRFFRHVLDTGGFLYFVRMLAGFTLVSFLVTTVVGWILHCMVVIGRTKKRPPEV